MFEAEPTFQIKYRKGARSPFVELPNANFLSLQDAIVLADQLAKVVLRVIVVNTRNGKEEYSI